MAKRRITYENHMEKHAVIMCHYIVTSCGLT